MLFSEEQIRQFENDGFLIVESILDAARVHVVQQAMDRVYAGTYNRDIRPAAVRNPVKPFGTKSSVQWVLNARLVDNELWNLATDPALGRAAASLLRTASVSVVEDQLLDKPNQGAPVNLHQDYSYWRFSTSVNMLTCWIALSDMTVDMGPVELARGSHTWGFAARPRELIHGSSDEYLAVAQSVIPADAHFDFIPATVLRGGGVFFYGLTFHGSRGNSTDHIRRAISLHWAGEDCRLDRSKLLDYDHPYLFSGLRQGDHLTNKYIPKVYPAG
jgi:ectoine hydroxylase-related dioxygenase (phytanoyl-CoA dioxygenase family)